MKPHLRLWMSVWHCYVPGTAQIVCGLGYTPADAWIDWRILMNTDAAAVPSAATT